MNQATTNAVSNAVTAITAFVLKMEVNKKENGEYKLIGSVDVPVFQLSDFGLTATSNGVDADGLPTYEDPKVQFVQDAITSAIKAIARNKLVSGSIVTKAGTKIATSVAELLESSQNSGAALALHRDFVNAFTAFLTTSGKSAAVQSVFTGLVKVKAGIALANEARRKGLQTQLENFLGSLDEAGQTKYLAIIEGLDTLCQDAVELDDSEF